MEIIHFVLVINMIVLANLHSPLEEDFGTNWTNPAVLNFPDFESLLTTLLNSVIKQFFFNMFDS